MSHQHSERVPTQLRRRHLWWWHKHCRKWPAETDCHSPPSTASDGAVRCEAQHNRRVSWHCLEGEKVASPGKLRGGRSQLRGVHEESGRPTWVEFLKLPLRVVEMGRSSFQAVWTCAAAGGPRPKDHASWQRAMEGPVGWHGSRRYSFKAASARRVAAGVLAHTCQHAALSAAKT